MRASRMISALVLLLLGLVWLGQGSGLVGGSSMSGQPFWAAVGAILIVAAIGLVVLERRHATGR